MSEGVPEGWEVTPIGSATSFSQGIQVDVEYQHEKVDDEKVRFVRISDYTKSNESPRYVDKSLAVKGLVDKDDVVMIRYGEAGRVCRGIVGAIANNLFTIKPNEIIEREYLFQYLTSKEVSQKIDGLAASSAMPAISFSSLKTIQLNIPSLPEQKKIASILTSVDDVIENTQCQIDKLQDLKKATMNELLTKGIGHTEFKDSELGRIPKSWEVMELRENLEFISYGFTNPMPESDLGNIMVTAKDVKNGVIAYETARRTTNEAYDTLLTEKSRPKIGDILLTKDGTLGRVAVVDRGGICINQSVAVLRPNSQISSLFLFFLLSAPNYQKIMLENAGGSTIKHIYITIVDKMKVAVPQHEEQQNIVSALVTVNKHLNTITQKLAQTQSLKKSLMQDLLTGKVRVQVN